MKPLDPRSLSITTPFCDHYQASVSTFELEIPGEYGRSIGCLHNGPQLSEFLLNGIVLAQGILPVDLGEIQHGHVALGWLHQIVEQLLLSPLLLVLFFLSEMIGEILNHL